MGPLHGVKVVELTGIGPGPFAGNVALRHGRGGRAGRAGRAGRRRRRRPSGFIVDGRGRRAISDRPQAPRRGGGRAAPGRAGRRADRRVPARGDRAARARSRRLPRPQPAPRVRAHDRLGSGRARSRTRPATTSTTSRSPARSRTSVASGQPPTPPLNMVGDYGGGGMFLAFGVVCAILEARASGQGQVVDAAMVDGAAYLMGPIWGLRGMGGFAEERGTNLLDTGSPFYDVYETADGEWVSIGSIEPQFYRAAARAHRHRARRPPAPDGPQSAGRCCASGSPTCIKAKTRAEWVDDARRHRRVLRAGAADERGEAAPAPGGARDHRRARRHRPARAGAALLADAAPRSRVPPRSPASTPRPCSPTTASPPTRSTELARVGRGHARSELTTGRHRVEARGELVGGRRRPR